MRKNYCFFANVVESANIHYKRFARFVNHDCADFSEIGIARVVMSCVLFSFGQMHGIFVIERVNADKYAIYLEGELQGYVGIL